MEKEETKETIKEGSEIESQEERKEETNKGIIDDEGDMDDLFGDTDEEVDEPIDNNEESENGEEEVSEELQRAELTLPRHPRSHSPLNHDVLMFNLPRFLSVDPEPFAPNSFEQQLSDFIKTERDNQGSEESKIKTKTGSSLKDSIQFKKLQLLNTIRWRYAKTPSGDLYKQSNTKIIEWEDGTMSMKLGNEHFEIRANKNEDNILAFQGGQVLVGTVNVNKAIKVLPPSTDSIAHKILASTIQNNMKLKRTKKINTMITRVDPELKARENERALKEIEKARRRQMAKIEQQEEKLNKGSRSSTSLSGFTGDNGIDFGEDDEDEDDDYAYAPKRGGKHGATTTEEGYENDDFVVGDDEEIEQGGEDEDEDELDRAAERLKLVKREGEKKYSKKRGLDEDADKIDDEAEEEDQDGEDGAVVTKKRRVILGNDEDEE
ncbi:hypothetical protein FOA43_002591 [Brettanomyces nanus]|uniref:RNA polymerase-associated protein LEO1 n=1 Tax=Eeniella nana TaxID=13502 RepID=A0A875S0D7_EENNA|nr:uncharacterized protein FOA43_002591 [Brettanomyces nanus]QPG75241.1 hypothetical protein FOA43_002591 [Brettanomyces nanus]